MLVLYSFSRIVTLLNQIVEKSMGKVHWPFEDEPEYMDTLYFDPRLFRDDPLLKYAYHSKTYDIQ
jgi:hypothetical protein